MGTYLGVLPAEAEALHHPGGREDGRICSWSPTLARSLSLSLLNSETLPKYTAASYRQPHTHTRAHTHAKSTQTPLLSKQPCAHTLAHTDTLLVLIALVYYANTRRGDEKERQRERSERGRLEGKEGGREGKDASAVSPTTQICSSLSSSRLSLYLYLSHSHTSTLTQKEVFLPHTHTHSQTHPCTSPPSV